MHKSQAPTQVTMTKNFESPLMKKNTKLETLFGTPSYNFLKGYDAFEMYTYWRAKIFENGSSLPLSFCLNQNSNEF